MTDQPNSPTAEEALDPHGARAPLDAARVRQLYDEAFIGSAEPDSGEAVEVEGIAMFDGVVQIHRFDKKRLDEYKKEIGHLLRELPDQFQRKSGGGWTFLNMCQDRQGRQWADLHQTMERLVLLGIGTGQADYLMPRDMWDVLPGGVPYIVVDPAP